jgi:hypothetical protein
LNAHRARLLGIDIGQAAALLHGWVRYWVSTLTGVQVIEEAYDAGTSDAASGAVQGFDSSVSARGLTERTIVARLRGAALREALGELRKQPVATDAAS